MYDMKDIESKRVILSYKSKTSEYPKPGSIIVVSEKTIVERINEINSVRDSEYAKMHKIHSKFAKIGTNVPLPTLLLQNDIELRYKVQCNCFLKVDEIIQSGNKSSILLKCKLPMFVWPEDVDVNEQYVYVKDYETEVVELVLCSDNQYLSADKPDGINTFGFYDQNLSVEGNKIWRAYSVDELNMSINVEDFVLTMGLKNFSTIIHNVEITKPVKQIVENSNDTNVNDNIDYNEIEQQLIEELTMRNIDEFNKFPNSSNTSHKKYEKFIKSHPLYEYTLRMYEGVRSLIDEFVVSKKLSQKQIEELDDNVYFELFDVMLRTQSSANTKLHHLDKIIIKMNNDDDNEQMSS